MTKEWLLWIKLPVRSVQFVIEKPAKIKQAFFNILHRTFPGKKITLYGDFALFKNLMSGRTVLRIKNARSKLVFSNAPAPMCPLRNLCKFEIDCLWTVSIRSWNTMALTSNKKDSANIRPPPTYICVYAPGWDGEGEEGSSPVRSLAAQTVITSPPEMGSQINHFKLNTQECSDVL